MKKRIISLALSVILLISLVPYGALASSVDLMIYHEGAVSRNVVLPQDERIELTAVSSVTSGVNYQWQILAPVDMWVDISGETDRTISLSYAMVATLLEYDTVTIRVKAETASGVVFSEPTKVVIDYTPISDTPDKSALSDKTTMVSKSSSEKIVSSINSNSTPATEATSTTQTDPSVTIAPEATGSIKVVVTPEEVVTPEPVSAFIVIESPVMPEVAETPIVLETTEVLEATETPEAIETLETPEVTQVPEVTVIETFDIQVSQEWIGPEADITSVKLFADGVEKNTLELTASTGWIGGFFNLPKHNAENQGIVYEIVPTKIDGYMSMATTSVDGTTVTVANTYIEEKVNVEIEKVWDGSVGEAATVVLYQDGNITDKTFVLSEENQWKNSFTGLARYNENGLEIQYTAEEEDISTDLLLSETNAADEEPVLETHSIVINYVFENGDTAAPAYIAKVAKGTPFQDTVTSPEVMGYAPVDEEKTIILSYDQVNQDYTITVTYKPVEVKLVINHYQQNTINDNYTLRETVETTGLTESEVGDGRAKTYTGFYALNYDKTEKVAADGSTVINIYYDRLYYLMKFNLDGGYGVDPIYGRYGSTVTLEEIGTPSKAGYSFAGWKLGNTLVGANHFPTTIPAEVRTYTATWTAGTVGYKVVFWYENADDTNYSYRGEYNPPHVEPGTSVSSYNYRNLKPNNEPYDLHFTHDPSKDTTVNISADGTTIVNVYYNRKSYNLTFYEGRNLRHTITAKYGQYIADKFPIPGYEGRAWESTNTTLYPYALQTLDRMPGENVRFNLYRQNSYIEKTINYYGEKVDGTGYDLLKTVKTYFNFITYEEEYHPILGFDRLSRRDAGFDNNNRKDFIRNNVDLYYKRSSYNLRFNNYGNTLKIESMKYQAPLSVHESYIPPYPASDQLEQDAYDFAGWFTSPVFDPNTKVNFATDKMPSSDLNFYAKWELKERTVKFYLTEDSENTIEGYDYITVQHGKFIEEEIVKPENGNYTFVGWFYKDGNKERAFDPLNMPVRRDLNLYAKWTSDTVMEYKVYYKDEEGNPIATETSGSKLAGTSITVEAKTGDKLDDAYQEGYFPIVASHTIVIDLDDLANNEFTFIYKKVDKVPYTVRYLERNTNDELADPKNGETSFAVITEQFKFVKNYLPDALQKRLILTAEGSNELIFWYEYDELHAPILTTYYQQNVSGDGYTEVARAEDFNALIGESYSAEELTYPGFTLDTSRPESERKVESLTSEGYEFKLFYNRNLYPYRFEYLKLEGGDRKPIPTSSVDAGNQIIYVAPTTGTARYESQVSQEKKDIPGYTYSESSEYKIIPKIQIEEEGALDKNRREFIYTENTATIKYVVIPNDYGTMGGDLDRVADTNIKVFTGNPQGSIPTARTGFKFVGWYKDNEGNEPISSTDGTTGSDNKFVPDKTKKEVFEGNDFIMYENKTYYAKFERELADLTISKTGSQAIDENQSFVFNVTGNAEDNWTKDISLTVTVLGNGSVTIKDLPVGNYVVIEDQAWSWRYGPVGYSETIEISAVGGNIVVFNNVRANNKWLSGDSYDQNIFGPLD